MGTKLVELATMDGHFFDSQLHRAGFEKLTRLLISLELALYIIGFILAFVSCALNLAGDYVRQAFSGWFGLFFLLKREIHFIII